MNETIYTVRACRFGDRESHSYIVGVYEEKPIAQKASEVEENHRGGKYECEILEWKLESKSKDRTYKMPYKTIKAI